MLEPKTPIEITGSVEVDVPNRLGRVSLRLFEELGELLVQDVLLRLLGFDRGRELLLTLFVFALQSAERVVHGRELAGRLRRLEVDDRLQLGIDLQPGVAAGTDELEVHVPSLPRPFPFASPPSPRSAGKA